MRDVKLVRLSDDGTHVVLAHEGTGEEFALRIDDRLRGFVTSDRARVGQLPLERPSRLSPKEIQARLRAGESSEDIAAAADVPLDRIMRYAGPVLAEREYIAQQAGRALLRRPPGGGPAQSLGDTVNDCLKTIGANSDRARWDAWRMPDGRWAVAVIYDAPGSDEESKAVFGFDPVGRTVVAVDEAAEWMLGERTVAPQHVVEGPGPRTPREARPRLTAVPSPVEPTPSRTPEHTESESIVRPIRPTPAPPAASSGPAPEDRTAYEPTVDLSRTMHDEPSPAATPTASTQPSTPPRTVARSEYPSGPTEAEPPRLSPDELPDLGAAPRIVAPSATGTTRHSEDSAGPSGRSQVAPPEAVLTSNEQPQSASTSTLASESTSESTSGSRSALVSDEPEPEATPAPAPEPIDVPIAEPLQSAEPLPTTAENAPAAKAAPEAEEAPDSAPEPDASEDQTSAAAQKPLGQDRRTSGTRRRRAAGSKRKGSVPSWDDILFGGGRKD